MASILITGASRGFGRELAEVYRQRGWSVFPLVRRPESAREWAGCENCHPICADVGLPTVEKAIAAVLGEHTSAVDVLVNNAGDVKKLRWLPATEPADIEELVRVHCVGAFRATRAALPFLRLAPRPAVVNITSRFGSIARTVAGDFRGIYSYAIAKSALNMLTACLDRELRAEGIRVYAVHPGRLKTTAAAVDADTEPQIAAEKLAAWLESADRTAECRLHDLQGESVLPW